MRTRPFQILVTGMRDGYGRFFVFFIYFFFGPRLWHIEIRHRVEKTSTTNLFGFELLKLKIRRLTLWKPTHDEHSKIDR